MHLTDAILIAMWIIWMLSSLIPQGWLEDAFDINKDNTSSKLN